MKRLSAFAVAAAIMAGAILAQPALSDEPGKAGGRPLASQDSGKAPGDMAGFAQGACGDCHAVRSPGISPNPEAPTFADIANREDLSAETLSKWLRDAHNYPAAMRFDLNRSDVDALTAYILTLRDKNYKPPIN